MSFDLCRVKTAEKPFFIENIGISIYSAEELCFFLRNNIYLIDESIMNEALCDWIRDELGLKGLYRQLYEQLQRMEESEEGADRSGAAAGFVMPIFREIGYLPPRQLKSYQEQLGRLAVQPEDARDKLKGDYLSKSGMFGNAVNEYLKILNRRGKGGGGAQFYAQVLESLGCAYARMFRFEEAADAFEQAYRMSKSKDALRRYVSVLPFYLPDVSCERKIRDLGADLTAVETIRSQNLRVAKQEKRKQEARAGSLPDSLSMPALKEQLNRLQEEYRRFSHRNARD